VAGVLPPGVEPKLALPQWLRRHGVPLRQDDRELHRGSEELQDSTSDFDALKFDPVSWLISGTIFL